MNRSVAQSLLVACLLLSGLTVQAQVVPGAQWDALDEPAATGWDPERLRSFEQFLIDDTHITGLMIIHKGRVAYQFGDITEKSYIASIRKSVLAMWPVSLNLSVPPH